MVWLVSPGMRISNLKLRLAESWGLIQEEFMLCCNGKILQDGRLSEYGVETGSVKSVVESVRREWEGWKGKGGLQKSEGGL